MENGIQSEQQGTVKFFTFIRSSIRWTEFNCLPNFCRVEQEGSLIVDGGVVVTGSSPGLLNQLNINNGLFLGKIKGYLFSYLVLVFKSLYRKNYYLNS